MITTTMSNGMPVAGLQTWLKQPIQMDDDLIDEIRLSFAGLEFGGHESEALTIFEQREMAADVIDDVISYLARKNPNILKIVEA